MNPARESRFSSSFIMKRRTRSQAGQALVELYFFMIIMFFFAIGSFEIALAYHNMNVVNNALKQATWLAAMGATNEEIIATIYEADTQMHHSGFLMHAVSNFGLSVGVPLANGNTQLFAPDPFVLKDGGFSGGNPTFAAYLYRAQDYNVRMGCQYSIAFSTPLGSTVYLLPTRGVWLAATQPIIARNDEDRDGLNDTYEPELFCSNLGEDTWVAFSHRDDGFSDWVIGDVDEDLVADGDESGLYNYDFDNDGRLDKFDHLNTNHMRHPILGGDSVVIQNQ